MPRWRALEAAVICGFALIATALPATATGAEAMPTAPGALSVDGQPAPLGVEPSGPQFGWQLTGARNGLAQTAYQLRVTNSANQLTWDSGRVASAREAFVDYKGPPLASDSAYTWSVRIWDEAGKPSPFASPARFTTGLTDADWQASWIRRQADPAREPDQYTFARKEVQLAAGTVTQALAYVSASQQFELWVNGSRLAKGPSFGYPDAEYYQTVDVTSVLRANQENAIGVLAHWYGPGKGRDAGVPGLIVQIAVDFAGGNRQLILSDGTWRVTPGPWLPAPLRNLDSGDFVERIDGTAWPVGWDNPGFDDSHWTAATVIGRHPTPPFTHLVSQRTRIVETPVRPMKLVQLPSGSYVADFGVVLAAVPTVDFHHGTQGHMVNLRAGYLLEPSGTVSTTKGVQQSDMSYQYRQRAGEQTFHPYVYLGFRYLQIDDPGEPLRPDDVVALARHNAVPDEHASTFSTDNPTLQAIWDLARRSALYASQEQFIDTPTREKGAFLRDGFNISETAMRAFGEQNLTRQALLDFGQSQARFWPDGRINAVYPAGEGKRDIPDFTEIYPEWVWQYYENTGDVTLLAQLYPVLTNIAAYVSRYVNSTTGLVTDLAGGGGDYEYGIIDWPPAMRYGYDRLTTARTVINILAVDVYQRVAAVAAALGRPRAESDGFQGRAGALTQAINQQLTRSDGAYTDGLRSDGSQSPHASEQANAMALAFGVAPPERQNAVGAYVSGLGMAMGPMTVESLLRALNDVGRNGDLVRLLTDARQPGWANLLARGGTFTWETWDPTDVEGDSMSHGWGSTVLVVMQEALLGVRPLGAGWSSFEVRPPTDGLAHASGQVTTPYGPISVSWQHRAATFDVDVKVPANTHATVAIPASGADHVSHNHARFVRMDNGAAVFSVSSGSYHFASRSSAPGRPVWGWVVGVVVAAILAAMAFGLFILRRRGFRGPADRLSPSR